MTTDARDSGSGIGDSQEREPVPASANPESRITTPRLMDQTLINRIVEAALLASAAPMSLAALQGLFGEDEPAPAGSIEAALAALQDACAGRGVELVEVASGWRYQVQADVHPYITRMWTERKTRYTRATLETLALIAYRQPITRGEIEQVRGVAVSSNIIQALEEREWIRVVGHRDVPGKPALFGTTRGFLDYFGLKRLDELPPLSEIRDLGELEPQLPFDTAPIAAGLGDASRSADAAGDADPASDDASATPGIDEVLTDTATDGAPGETATGEVRSDIATDDALTDAAAGEVLTDTAAGEVLTDTAAGVAPVDIDDADVALDTWPTTADADPDADADADADAGENVADLHVDDLDARDTTATDRDASVDVAGTFETDDADDAPSTDSANDPDASSLSSLNDPEQDNAVETTTVHPDEAASDDRPEHDR